MTDAVPTTDSRLVDALLPVLGRSLEATFNVFDVMHHGLHEKQISNVFAWLLSADGTHRLDDRFQRILVEEVNHRLGDQGDLPVGPYAVLQEVNTAAPGEVPDIADLVLEESAAAIVVENYFTSDGHGHSYDSYLQHSRRGGRRGEVVLLCRDEDASLQTLGWERAPVVTYAGLLGRLLTELRPDHRYQRDNPEAYSFIEQMQRKVLTERGRSVDQDVLNFLVAMCDCGEARRYQVKSPDVAAEEFANDLAEQARHRFGEGRELLQRAKARLRAFGDGPLREQLEDTFGSGSVRDVSARYAGVYQWTINFTLDEGAVAAKSSEDSPSIAGPDECLRAPDEAMLQIKFGPSAWHSNAQDSAWRNTVPGSEADYSRLFITRAKTSEIRQSSVTLQEVLDGIESSDRRLHEEIVDLLGAADG